jgi:polyhydroxybutyrate depolymerase
LEALIDTISAQYTINAQRIYCAGMSNGSFMAYYLACESNRFAAIGTVTGSMSVDMYNSCNPVYPIPSIHIHGTADDVNPYEGTSTMIGIDAMNNFWVNQNSCDVTPVVTNVPDVNTSDDATATRYVYADGINGNTVELFKITDGEHTWPGWPMPASSDIICMDFDACNEIWRFFSQYERPVNAALEEYPDVILTLWPNPGRGNFSIQAVNKTVTEVIVYNLQGRIVENISGENIQFINLDHLHAGKYVVQLSGDDFCVTKKLVIAQH